MANQTSDSKVIDKNVSMEGMNNHESLQKNNTAVRSSDFASSAGVNIK